MQQTAKTGVLLVNLGTPDSPETPDVRRYLREFLSDERVIDTPALNRFLLVNLIIAPFRSPKSSKEYKKVWTERGSPLLFHGIDLAEDVQQLLGENFVVSLGMRYGNPSIESALNKLKDKGLDRIVVFPLFPQYASASTGSAHQKVMEVMGKWQTIPQTVFIDSYPGRPGMIKIFADNARKFMAETDFDHFLFSYHGLPERQIRKADPTGDCLAEGKNCCDTFGPHNRLCYRAQCFETSRKLAKELGIGPDDYTVAFQSRLGKTPWIKPYTDDVIKEMPAAGRKKVLAFSPAFTADCLETTIEVGEEYKDIFEEAGGTDWHLVPSLNSEPAWSREVAEMIRETAG